MSTTGRSAKTVTRRRVRAARARRPPAAARAVEAALARALPEALAAAPTLRPRAGADGPGGAVAVYTSLPGEPGTALLRRTLRDLGRRVLLPVLLADLDLDWVLDDGPGGGPVGGHGGGPVGGHDLDPLRPEGRRLGPAAVASCSLVLLPALAVDRSGTRLGQGGGSYDRALARLGSTGPPGSHRPLVLAVVHDEEVLDDPLPVEPHDVRVDGALTPSGLLLLR